MALDSQQVIELIEQGVSPKIALARKKAEKINMHITGKNVKMFLETLDNYETPGQKILREKLVKDNRSLFSFILRPLDKIFSAKGGSVNYNLPQATIEVVKSQINDVADGLDIKKYLKKVVKKHYLIDPNGIIFIDIDREGKLETHVVNTKNLFWYDNKGNDVKAIIFAPVIKEEDKGTKREGTKYYRVIDEKTDRIFIQKDNKVSEDTKETLGNFFGFVPAKIMGDEKNPNEDIYESIISDIVADADEMLRDISVKTVHKLAHAYPKYWSYEQACTKCAGEGQVVDPKDPEGTAMVSCSSCGGDGVKKKTSPSDEIVLRQPMEGESTLAPHVAGFVQPDLQTMEFYERSIEKAKNAMFQAMWGTTYEQGGKRETATGRFLDAQPVQDRLKDTSETFSKFHKFMLDCYVKVILQDKNYQSGVSYGQRYILEGPDDILDKYTEVSREKVSELVKLDLLNRYFDAEYQDDKVELLKKKKLMRVEPFPTMTVMEVVGLEWLPTNEKQRKVYFTEWKNTLTEQQLVFWNEERMKKELDKYIATKTVVVIEQSPDNKVNQN